MPRHTPRRRRLLQGDDGGNAPGGASGTWSSVPGGAQAAGASRPGGGADASAGAGADDDDEILPSGARVGDLKHGGYGVHNAVAMQELQLQSTVQSAMRNIHNIRQVRPNPKP